VRSGRRTGSREREISAIWWERWEECPEWTIGVLHRKQTVFTVTGGYENRVFNITI